MITVIASITVKVNRKEEFIELFKANVPVVLNEIGCIEYYPAVDFDTGLPQQALESAVVTIIEKWQSVTALKDHMATSHMRTYQEQVKEMVTYVSVKVLQAV